MASRAGRKPKPARLKLVEGNPGKRPIPETVQPAPGAPKEPDWTQFFPALKPLTAAAKKKLTDEARKIRAEAEVVAAINARAREVARAEWRRIVPILDHLGVLSVIDSAILVDLCICSARIDQCERDISMHGVWVAGERGAQKNPSITAANNYRAQLKFYVGELGLSPASRLKSGGAGAEGDDVFD